ncbi:MAG: hypothetical protein VCB99_07050, partial [Myxococcota bacterium]
GVLEEIGVAGTPELLVFNQIDRLPSRVGAALAKRHGGVAVSALKSRGLDELVERAQILLFDEDRGTAGTREKRAAEWGERR